MMPSKAVYSALGLDVTASLRRWFKRIGINMLANGSLSLAQERLAYYRVRRGLSVAVLLANSGGEATLDDVVSRIHRPPELMTDDDWQFYNTDNETRGRVAAQSDGGERAKLPVSSSLEMKPTAQAAVSPPEASAEKPLMSYLFDALEEAEPDENAETALLKASGGPDVDAADETKASGPPPPLWISVWVRHYFDVVDEVVRFPQNPKPRAPTTLEQEPMEPLDPDSAAAKVPRTFVEEEGMLMKVSEELRLRYGRAHITVVTGCFQGVRASWIRRFFDITTYGDVLVKAVDRQVREAIAVGREIYKARAQDEDAAPEDEDEDATLDATSDVGQDDAVELDDAAELRDFFGSGKGDDSAEGEYTVEDAFRDFGASRFWLRGHFRIEEGASGALSFDGDVARAWEPTRALKAPNPYTYAKLDVPRGYIRKGNGKYGKKGYKHHAGGILY